MPSGEIHSNPEEGRVFQPLILDPVLVSSRGKWRGMVKINVEKG